MSDAKNVEILILRHQLEVLHRRKGRPRFRPHDRMLLAALARVLPRDRWRCLLVRPETVLRWHRQLVTGRARRWGRKNPGRPPTPKDLRDLVIRLARENARWVYLRIRGELKRLVDGPVGVFGTHSLKQWRGIASRHDKYAITYLGGVILATIVLNHRVRI